MRLRSVTARQARSVAARSGWRPLSRDAFAGRAPRTGREGKALDTIGHRPTSRRRAGRHLIDQQADDLTVSGVNLAKRTMSQLRQKSCDAVHNLLAVSMPDRPVRGRTGG